MSSNRSNLLQKSSFNPRVICLYPDKDQQSEIESDHSQSNKHPISHTATKNSRHQGGSHQCLSHQIITTQMRPKPLQVRKPGPNLLQPPSKDYAEKSQIYLEKRIEQRVTINYEKESFFGKRKNKVIEISDVSSESEAESLKGVNKKPSKQRKLNEWQEEDEILQKYSIGGFQISKKNKNSINAEQQQPQEDNLKHLHPDYEQEKKGPASDKGSDNLSEMNSDDSCLIIIRPKHKHTHKRLRKMVNVTNRVKIQNKQNSGETQDCPICLTDLNKKGEKKKGKLPCNHIFCLKCITESSKFSNKCPYCRATFNEIRCNGKRIEVQDTRQNEEFEDPEDEPCYICGRNSDFERLLECEFCEYAYCHTYCDPRLNNRQLGAEEAWYCASCEELMRHRLQNGEEEEGQEGQLQNEEENQGEEVPGGRSEGYSEGEYVASDQNDE